MHVRSILTGILPLLLGGVLVTACDKTDATKTDEKKAEAKVDEKKADDLKADAKADEAKVDAKADDLKAVDDAAGADGAVADGGAEGKADDMKADPDTKADDMKADPDTKADDMKADPDAKADKKPDDKPDAKTDKKPDDKPEPVAAKIDGKKLYSDKCASCHGGSGKADTKLGEKHKIPSWSEPGWKAKWSQSKVEDIVTKGKADTKMKAFGGKLTPDEIKAVSTYARGLGK